MIAESMGKRSLDEMTEDNNDKQQNSVEAMVSHDYVLPLRGLRFRHGVF